MHSVIVAALLFAVQSLGNTLIDRQFPHLIIPVSEQWPDVAYGTKYEGNVTQQAGGTNRVYTEILFDVPANSASKCEINFFVDKSSPHALKGSNPYTLNVFELVGTPNKTGDTWNNRPDQGQWVATFLFGQDSTVRRISGGSTTCYQATTANYLLTPGDPNNPFGYTWYELTQPLSGITYDTYS